MLKKINIQLSKVINYELSELKIYKSFRELWKKN